MTDGGEGAFVVPLSPAMGIDKTSYNLVVHGGCDPLTESMLSADQQESFRAGLSNALRVGEQILKNGGTSIDAVEAAVKSLEDEPLFNAGRGAVFSKEGKHELEASIMDGATLGCGAAGFVETIKNPIALAKLIMEDSPHLLLVGDGAEDFASTGDLEKVSPDYFSTEFRRKEYQECVDRDGPGPWWAGTVGAVARDKQGNLAAGTSTGGLEYKDSGRLGDSCIIGAGTYAHNDTCAISCTGVGRDFIRHAVAHEVHSLLRHERMSLSDAMKSALEKKQCTPRGGIIGVSRDGEMSFHYNGDALFRGMVDSSGKAQVGFWDDMWEVTLS